VKFAAIDDDAANRGTMSTDKLGGRVHNDIGTVLQRLYQVGCRQCVVDNERQTVLVCDIGYGANIQRIQARIAQRLGEDGFGAIINSSAEVLRVAAINEAYIDTEFGQGVMEKI